MEEKYLLREGPPLIDGEYLITGIAEGKKSPVRRDWVNNPFTKGDCLNSPALGVGIICGQGEWPVYGLDFDIPDDPDCAAALRERLEKLLDCPLPCRVGLPPKFLVPVLMEPGIHKECSPWYSKETSRARLELLGKGQQFVAYGIHPGTGAPYRWESPLPGEASMLPYVEEEALAPVFQMFDDVLFAHGWTREGEAPTVSAATADELAPPLPPVENMDIKEAREVIFSAGSPAYRAYDEYDSWLGVGMALHHQFSGSDEALALWDEWSMQSKKWEPEACARKWRSFTNRRLSRTMRHYLPAGWREEKSQSREFTIKGRALRMHEEFGSVLCYAPDAGKHNYGWYKWDGCHWNKVPEAVMLSYAAAMLGGKFLADIRAFCTDDTEIVSVLKLYKRWQECHARDNLLRCAEAMPDFWCNEGSITPEVRRAFNHEPRWFGVGNGDIDLTSGVFYPPDWSRYISKHSSVDYDAKAECPLWKKTLLEVFKGNRESIAYLQRVFGYALMGNPKEEVMFILCGSGANGKSTVVNTVASVIGSYACAMSAGAVTSLSVRHSGSSSGPRPDFVATRNCRMTVISETDEGAMLKTATVKSLVSTDAVVARGLYSNPVTFKPTAVPFMMTNNKPEIKETDNGIWRRIRLIEFNEQFDESRRDVDLSVKLEAEYSGILNWLIEGALAYQREGLNEPGAFKEQRSAYRAEQDVVQQWLDECCEVGPGYKVLCDEAYSACSAWLETRGYFNVVKSRRGLTGRLSSYGIHSKQQRVGTARACFYLGFRLNRGGSPALPDDEEVAA